MPQADLALKNNTRCCHVAEVKYNIRQKCSAFRMLPTFEC